MPPTYLTPQEIAGRWRVDPKTVRRRIAAGDLRGVRLGPGVTRVDLAEVERYEAAATTGAEAA